MATYRVRATAARSTAATLVAPRAAKCRQRGTTAIRRATGTTYRVRLPQVATSAVAVNRVCRAQTAAAARTRGRGRPITLRVETTVLRTAVALSAARMAVAATARILDGATALPTAAGLTTAARTDEATAAPATRGPAIRATTPGATAARMAAVAVPTPHRRSRAIARQATAEAVAATARRTTVLRAVVAIRRRLTTAAAADTTAAVAEATPLPVVDTPVAVVIPVVGTPAVTKLQSSTSERRPEHGAAFLFAELRYSAMKLR